MKKVTDVLSKLLDSFESGNVPEAIAISILPRQDVPSSKWSLSNRLISFLSGTSDARGFRQWKEVDRWPGKGSKAIHILTPRHKKVVDEATGEERVMLLGFAAVPVFRFEDTEGKPLDLPQLEPEQPPPLSDVAERWGLALKYQVFQGVYLGYFSSGRKQIALATHDEMVFFHELAHAAHERIRENLKPGQDWKQEIVAELTAAVLAHLYGRKTNDGAAYQYIRGCAEKAGKDVYRACLSVISDVGKCLELVIQASESVEVQH